MSRASDLVCGRRHRPRYPSQFGLQAGLVVGGWPINEIRRCTSDVCRRVLHVAVDRPGISHSQWATNELAEDGNRVVEADLRATANVVDVAYRAGDCSRCSRGVHDI